ncbi:MAG: hypothetical protein KC776_23065 [Myxococcales bacterium]|nr:hypothetical protein [Myxococcales bacterium]
MADDPKRLLDDADVDPELRDALGAAKSAAGPALDTAAGLARLQAAIGGGGGGGTSGGGGGAAAAKSTAAAWIGATAIVGSLAIGSALYVSTSQKPAAPLARELSGVASVVAKVDIAPPPTPTPVVAKPAVTPEPSARPAPAASAKPESKEDRVKREVAQLAKARAALASNPAQALTLANAGHQEFAGGLLYQEREAIAVLALARMGNTAAARSRGKAFLSRFPKGPAADSVRRAIGEPEQN